MAEFRIGDIVELDVSDNTFGDSSLRVSHGHKGEVIKVSKTACAVHWDGFKRRDCISETGGCAHPISHLKLITRPHGAYSASPNRNRTGRAWRTWECSNWQHEIISPADWAMGLCFKCEVTNYTLIEWLDDHEHREAIARGTAMEDLQDLIL